MSQVIPIPYADKVAAIALIFGVECLGVAALGKVTENISWRGVFTGDTQSDIEARYAKDHWLSALSVTTVGAVRYAAFSEGSAGVYVGRNGWLFSTEELTHDPKAATHIEAAADRVLHVRDALRARGIQLLPVLVPDKAEIYGAKLDANLAAQSKAKRDMFGAALAARDVLFWDTAEALRVAMAQGPVFMKDDTHWSPSGARIAAETTAAVTHQLGLDLAKANVNTSVGPSVPFDGDLLSFVPTGNWRPFVGPEQASIQVVHTQVETAAGLFGDAEPEVALVGTSFSARPEFNFLGFLQQSLSADVLNFAQEGRGPFEPMDDFLASDVLQNSPPKLVVWEIPVRYVTKDLAP